MGGLDGMRGLVGRLPIYTQHVQRVKQETAMQLIVFGLILCFIDWIDFLIGLGIGCFFGLRASNLLDAVQYLPAGRLEFRDVPDTVKHKAIVNLVPHSVDVCIIGHHLLEPVVNDT